MVNKNSIIENVYNRKDITNYIKKVGGRRFADDLRSEFLVVLCKQKEDHLIKKYTSDHFNKYLFAIVNNIWRSHKFLKDVKKPINSKIFKGEDKDNKYDKMLEEIAESIPDSSLDDYLRLENIIDDLPQLSKEVLNLYIENNSSIKKVSDSTNIPRKYLTDSLNQSRKTIDKDYER